jgi:exodeoxyribonuclease VIII
MINHNLTNDAYHADPAIGCSGLKTFLAAPAHYFERYRKPGRPPMVPTAAMEFGTAWHAALFEPERFMAEYVAVPEGIDKRSTAGKAFFADIEKSGRTPMKFDAYADLVDMRQAAHASPFWSRVMRLDGWQAEQSIFVNDEATGLVLKIRPDLMHAPCDEYPNGVIIDGKTCASAAPAAFGRAIWTYGYHLQAAFYADVYQRHYRTPEPPEFILFAQEKTAPYLCKPYTVPADALQYARDIIEDTLEEMAKCERSGVWPGYGDEIEPATLPGYARFEIEGGGGIVSMEIVEGGGDE